MKIEIQKIKEDFSRDLYWSRIYFFSDDDTQKSKVLVSASFEYFQQLLKKTTFQEEDFNSWMQKVVDKWRTLGNEIFNQDIHYDVYATTPEGEVKELDFLIEKAKS